MYYYYLSNNIMKPNNNILSKIMIIIRITYFLRYILGEYIIIKLLLLPNVSATKTKAI